MSEAWPPGPLLHLYRLDHGQREVDALARSLDCVAAPEGFQGGDSLLTEAVWRLVAAQERTNGLLAGLLDVLENRR